MELGNKKLLVLTGCNGAEDIIRYAKTKGVFVIATDFYKESEVKKLADVSYSISTTDIDGIEKLAKKYNVNGITTGTSESSMFTIMKVTEKLGLPFYTNEEQIELINDKKRFKELLKANDVGVTPEFEDYSNIIYPVIIKPVDSSGSKGISIATNNCEFKESLSYALKNSRSKKVIVEKYLQGYPEVFFNYTIVDGEFSLSCSFDNNKVFIGEGFSGLPTINIYPSKRTKLFIEKANSKIINTFKSIGLRNGVIAVQTFFDGSDFLVYEAGYRLGGTQSYILINENNGINHMEMMVNFALTGKMIQDKTVLNNENPFFKKPSCQLNIPLKAGKISSIEGVNNIRYIQDVVNITQVRNVGDEILNNGTTSQLVLRIHIVSDSLSKLADVIDDVLNMLKVFDLDGNDMVIDRNKLRLKNYI